MQTKCVCRGHLEFSTFESILRLAFVILCGIQRLGCSLLRITSVIQLFATTPAHMP